jgi:hypothetical protein
VVGSLQRAARYEFSIGRTKSQFVKNWANSTSVDEGRSSGPQRAYL